MGTSRQRGWGQTAMIEATNAALPPLCLPPNAHPSRPVYKLPKGSTDCHCHVYEDTAKYPLIEERSYTPAIASRKQYLEMCAIVGLERTVQVSASVYGTDNSLTLDVIAALGQHRARGIAGIHPQANLAELERLHEGGIRGVRVSTHVKGYGGTAAIAQLAPLIGPLGWHIQIHVHNANEIAELEQSLLHTNVPLVFDHMGAVRGSQGSSNQGFQALLRILKSRDDCWSKISSWHRRSDSGAPFYTDMQTMVEMMVDQRPDRLVFGTNWPNPALFPPQEMVDDGNTVDVFCNWVKNEETRKLILVENPAQLYGFDSALA
jgi:2-pyrone-4,6-dicarboxylate lactonase